MPVVVSQSLLASGSVSGQPLTHARIGHENIARGASAAVSASSTATGFFVGAPANPLTYEFWRAESLPAWWQVDAGEAVTVDYVGIAAHTIGSEGAAVKVQYSTNGTDWTDFGTEVAPSNEDGALMWLETAVSARYWRVYVSGAATPPSVGVVYIGEALAMARPIYGGHVPVTLSRRTTVRSNKSEKGQWLGRSVIRQGYATSFQWTNLEPDWYRANFDPFVKAARTYPFFVAWRPADYPDEVAYAWMPSPDTAPELEGGTGRVSVGIDVEGLAHV